MHFTNQPSESPAGFTFKNATVNATLPGEVVWSDWNEYRYDWLPGLSTWFVNGDETARIAFHAPETPAGLIVNMWSNGGSWTGNMSVGDEALLQIQWIEVVFNTSEPVNSTVGRRDRLGKGESAVFVEVASQEGDEVLKGIEASRTLASRADEEGCKVVCDVHLVKTVGTPVVSKSTAGCRRGIRSISSLVVVLSSVCISYLLCFN